MHEVPRGCSLKRLQPGCRTSVTASAACTAAGARQRSHRPVSSRLRVRHPGGCLPLRLGWPMCMFKGILSTGAQGEVLCPVGD